MNRRRTFRCSADSPAAAICWTPPAARFRIPSTWHIAGIIAGAFASISPAALREAQQKLGDHGLCVLADVCQLPFRDDAFEGVVSGYTLMHVDQRLQADALKELYRVLHPGKHLCVMTGVKTGAAHAAMLLGVRAIKKFLRLLGILPPPRPPAERSHGSAPPLYCHLQTPAWWRRASRRLSAKSRVEVLRLFHRNEFLLHFEAFSASGRMIDRIRWWEAALPRLMARAAKYVLVDLVKPIEPDDKLPR